MRSCSSQVPRSLGRLEPGSIPRSLLCLLLVATLFLTVPLLLPLVLCVLLLGLLFRYTLLLVIGSSPAAPAVHARRQAQAIAPIIQGRGVRGRGRGGRNEGRPRRRWGKGALAGACCSTRATRATSRRPLRRRG